MDPEDGNDQLGVSDPAPQVERTLTLDEKYQLARAHLATVQNGKRRGGYSLPREHFDPGLRRHIQSYKTFLDTGAWGDTLFHQEFPYDSVVETVTRKFALDVLNHMLSQ